MPLLKKGHKNHSYVKSLIGSSKKSKSQHLQQQKYMQEAIEAQSEEK